MTQPTVALIGYGNWGSKIAHHLNNYCEIVVVDPKKNRANTGYPVVSFKNILRDHNIRTCFIATPEQTHYRLVKELLLHKKNVWVEKPMCFLFSEAKELFYLARKNKVKLFIDTIYLFDPFSDVIHNFLQTTQDQFLSMKSTRYSDRKSARGLSPIDDLLIHDIYLIRFWFGGIKKIIGIKKEKTDLKISTINLQIGGSGILTNTTGTAELKYCWNATCPKREIEILMGKHILNWSKNCDKEKMLIKYGKKKKVYLRKPSALKKAIQFFLHNSGEILVSNKNKEFDTMYAKIGKESQLSKDIQWLEKIKKLI